MITSPTHFENRFPQRMRKFLTFESSRAHTKEPAQQPITEQPRDAPAPTVEESAKVTSAEPEEVVQRLADETAAAVTAPEENLASKPATVQDATFEELTPKPMPEIMEEDAK
eukprot:2130992-Amphidinium_carterae.1